MAIELDEAFIEALEFLRPYIKPVSDLSFFLAHLNAKKLPEQQPIEILRLLAMVFTKDQQWPSKKLREVLKRILQAEPSIETDPDYKTINDYLIERNL